MRENKQYCNHLNPVTWLIANLTGAVPEDGAEADAQKKYDQ